MTHTASTYAAFRPGPAAMAPCVFTRVCFRIFAKSENEEAAYPAACGPIHW